ncbi:MAG: fasciclin domain-containing protein [Flavobacteriaceae bacterium]|nr:fasciclin domain-containing protein [Eudoraea sp.]NNJ38535.1 fasciclin domain-containing protein [Flavobacteriaceae bacterium]
MKTSKTLFKTLILVFALSFIWACSDDDSDPVVAADPDIVDLALDTDDLSILVEALQAANLVTTLQGDGPFTVFAPTNAAFQAFLTDNNFASLSDVPVDVLTQVLLNHVVAGTNLSTGLSTSYVSSSSTAGAGGNALSLYINTASGVSINGVSDVVTPDVVASNGVVHIVDAVIGLPDVVDHAVANTDLSELVGALTANGNTTFTDLLSDDNTDFTVFAPVNSAFTAFTNPNSNELDNILSNHVIVGAAAASSGLSNSYLNTAGENGDGDNLSIYINTDNGVTLNGVSTVAAADIVATNGIIHAVDAVIDIPTVVTFAVADPTFAPLVTALTEGTPDTDFVTVLNGNGPFTVFAPTNTAFDNLLTALNLSEVTEIEQGLLTSVLNHHVVSGNIRSGDLTNPGDTVAPTLEGDNITITLPGTDNGVNIADVTDGAGNSGIGIIAVDVQAGNGVIHVLDTVLLPDTNN